MLTILPDSDPILAERMPEWDFAAETEARPLVQQMFDTMIAAKGIGLAANQVGLRHRLFIMGSEHDGLVAACFNPVVTAVDGMLLADEGCLSFPNLFLKVKRPEIVAVSYQDSDGAVVERTFDGIWARVFQHELDHLDGIVFTKRVSKLKLDMARKKLAKRPY